nr:hypothetical protein BaRGS_013324 [Batillaria attramentaria]
MMASKKVAVVTGSNKGIGFAIVRALCKQFDGDVYLTARDEGRGANAVEELNKEGLKPKFHQLDIDDPSSIDRLRDFLQKTYGGLDVLVNNAGIAYKVASTAPFAEQAEVTVKTNFWSKLNVCDKLFPLLRPHARVSNVSSMASNFAMKKCSKEIQDRFTDPNLTMDGLKQLMTEFVNLAKEGKHEAAGWPSSAYGVSKIGVTVMSFIQQRQFDAEKREDIIVNAIFINGIWEIQFLLQAMFVERGFENNYFGTSIYQTSIVDKRDNDRNEDNSGGGGDDDDDNDYKIYTSDAPDRDDVLEDLRGKPYRLKVVTRSFLFPLLKRIKQTLHSINADTLDNAANTDSKQLEAETLASAEKLHNEELDRKKDHNRTSDDAGRAEEAKRKAIVETAISEGAKYGDWLLVMTVYEGQLGEDVKLLVLDEAVRQNMWHVVTTLIRHDPEAHVHRPRFKQLIPVALEKRQWSVLEAMVVRGVSPDDVDTVYREALTHRRWSLLAALVKMGLSDVITHAAIHQALKCNEWTFVVAMVQGSWPLVAAILNPEVPNQLLNKILLAAAKAGQNMAAEICVKVMSLSRKSSSQEGAARGQKKQVDFVKLKDEEGNTIVQAAAGTVSLLLDAGAKAEGRELLLHELLVKARDQDEVTVPLLCKLIKAGADPTKILNDQVLFTPMRSALELDASAQNLPESLPDAVLHVLIESDTMDHRHHHHHCVVDLLQQDIFVRDHHHHPYHHPSPRDEIVLEFYTVNLLGWATLNRILTVGHTLCSPMVKALELGRLSTLRLIHASGACSNAELYRWHTKQSEGYKTRTGETEAILDYVKRAVSHPVSLKHQCRLVVSRVIGWRDRHARIRQLPMTPELQDYVMFRDVLTEGTGSTRYEWKLTD